VEVKAELNNRTIVLSVQFGGQGMLVKTNLWNRNIQLCLPAAL
jgi:hypothetical protein